MIEDPKMAEYLINKCQPRVEYRASYLTSDCPEWYDEVRDRAMEKVENELEKGKTLTGSAIRTYTYFAFIEILRIKTDIRIETFLLKQKDITDWQGLGETLSPESVKELKRREWTRSFMMNDNERENNVYDALYEELNNCPSNKRIFRHFKEQIPRKLIQDRFWKLQKKEDYLDWEVFSENEFSNRELEQIYTRIYDFNLAWCNRILLEHVFQPNILKRLTLYQMVLMNIDGSKPHEIEKEKNLTCQPAVLDINLKIRAELDKLDKEEYKIVDLMFNEGYSVQEVATILDTTETYVENKLEMIRIKLSEIKQELQYH